MATKISASGTLLRMFSILLCSQSPRRQEILRYFDIPFKQCAAAFDEASVPFLRDPSRYVVKIARGKAVDALRLHQEAILVTADTTVHLEGRIFNKPKDLEDAKQMLHALSGKKHEVFTGMCVCKDGAFYEGFEKTDVFFNALSKQQIDLYLQHSHWHDKAGAYTIQGHGSLLVKGIAGCYYNVLGMPIHLLEQLLAKVDISLWHHLRGP